NRDRNYLHLLTTRKIEWRFRYGYVIDSRFCMTRTRWLICRRVMHRSSRCRRRGRQRNREEHLRCTGSRLVCLSVSDRDVWRLEHWRLCWIVSAAHCWIVCQNAGEVSAGDSSLVCNEWAT